MNKMSTTNILFLNPGGVTSQEKNSLKGVLCFEIELSALSPDFTNKNVGSY